MPKQWTTLVVLAVLAGGPAHADEQAATKRPAALNVDWALDGSIAALSMAAQSLTGLFDKHLAPRHCTWCGTNAFDTGVRDALIWSDPKAADNISNVLATVLPLGITLYSFIDTHATEGSAEALKNVILIAEAVGLTSVITEIAKYSARRARPYVADGGGTGGGQDNLSFWSGHSAEIFSAVSAAGTVAWLRGYDDWPWIYAIGFPLVASCAYFRIAADKHWLSDTLVGAAVGTGVGFLVPWLHKGSTEGLSFRVVPTPNGFAVAGEF